MHTEFYQVTKEEADKINKAKQAGGRIVCVGTTSCRTIESAADEMVCLSRDRAIPIFSFIRAILSK